MVSFIYTHCPRVCPMTVHNLQDLQDSLSLRGMKGVEFVSLTYDPNRDSPSVLKRYADVRGIKLSDWDFLTGTKTCIDSVLHRVKISYTMVDSSHSKNGDLTYFIHHPDEVALVDERGNVRGLYGGSDMDFTRIIADIETL